MNIKKEGKHKRNITKNNIKYLVMVLIGFFATLLSIINIWVCETWQVIINIISMLGSGVFCSAIVSYFVETSNKKQLKVERQRQCEYILSTLKNNLKFLLMLESRNLSAYSIPLKDEEERKFILKKVSIKDACSEIKGFLKTINTSIQSRLWFGDNIIDLDKIKARNNFAYKNTLSTYQNIINILSGIMVESHNFYATGVFDEKIIDTLRGMLVDINSIVEYANENLLDLLVDFKVEFFENILTYMESLNMDFNEIIKCTISISTAK